MTLIVPELRRTHTLTWTEPTCRNWLTVHNKTVSEAIEEAKYFGYKEPEWWQFWKGKISIFSS